MKFENPIMNISMFEVENVVTQASGTEPSPAPQAAVAARDYIDGVAPAGAITVTF